jgi:phage/plasmid-like protein (TIGR03299 family)
MTAFFEQGFSVREPMWHGMGEVLADYPGREEAMRIAGHDFTVAERPVYLQNEWKGEGETTVKVDGWKALAREDTGKVLMVARQSYGVVQNDVLWNIVDAVVNQDKAVHYETAGVLKDGAVLWVLAWLDEPTTIRGDDSPTYPFVMASTTHDGSGSCQVRATNVRVVCMNTFSMAESQARASGFEFTFRHSSRVLDRIEDAKLVLSGVRANHAEFVELANELAAIPISVGQRELFVSELIPLQSEALHSDRVVTNVENARNAVRHILGGETIPDAHRETGYGLLLAGTEYLDHIRGARSQATFLGRSLLRNEPAKTKLATLVREVAEVR